MDLDRAIVSREDIQEDLENLYNELDSFCYAELTEHLFSLKAVIELLKDSREDMFGYDQVYQEWTY